jgi:diketogulonate reductase-like aldo/keto reductase
MATSNRNPAVKARGGLELPSLGLGTWLMGEQPQNQKAEVDALQRGMDLGVGLIDTAENYADGGSELVVGEAIKGRRDEVVIVTKVGPTKASKQGTLDNAEASLKRLGTDRIDLYLLHDEPEHPLEDTLESFERLKSDGKILHYGVSNFDLALMQKCETLELGANVECNQLRYALTHRALEAEILPLCEASQIAVMAYSPIGIGKLNIHPVLEQVARRHNVSPWCVAIAFTMRHPLLVSIPKASNPQHVEDNAKALDMTLTEQDLNELDTAYPQPPAGSFDKWD